MSKTPRPGASQPRTVGRPGKAPKPRADATKKNTGGYGVGESRKPGKGPGQLSKAQRKPR